MSAGQGSSLLAAAAALLPAACCPELRRADPWTHSY